MTFMVGAAFAFAAPAAMTEPMGPATMAAAAQVTTASVTQADNPAPKKTAKKKTAKKKAKKAVAKKAEPEPKKKSGGLFSTLFGGSSKPAEPEKPMTKAEKAKAAKAAKAAAAAEKAEKAKAAKEARAAAAAEKAEKAKAAKAAAAAEKAEKERLARIAAEKAAAEEAAIVAVAANAKGNSGELRSEPVDAKPQGFFEAVFGGKPKVTLLEETKALDAALTLKDRKSKFRVKPEFMPQRVDFSGYRRGQIVIDTGARFLYLIESSTSARRYAIAVGKEGLQFKGSVTVGDKQEWPRWIPTKEMQQRDPAKYGRYKDGMDGGGDNPLGARAIYLYSGKKDTHLRIHGTTQPETIGTSASNGCFRMVNEHVIELYSRVRVGTEVIVM